MFDPYRKWLGVPEGQRPPTHYQLLGISPDEQNREVINAAVVRQSAFVRNFQVGKHAADATRLLNEIAAAKVCLLDPLKRAAYDAQLKPAAKPGNPAKPTVTMSQPRESAPALSVVHSSRRSPATRAKASTAPDPLLSVPDTIWAADGHASPALEAARPMETAGKLPAWLWVIPAGSLGLVLVVVLLIALSRPPRSTSTVSQIDPASNIVEPRIDNGQKNPSVLPSSAMAPQGMLPPSSVSSPTMPLTPQAPAAVQPPTISSIEPDGDNPFQTKVDKAAKSTSPSRTTKTPDEPAIPSAIIEGATWDDGSKLSIPASRSDEVVFARPPGPFVAVDGVVYSLETGEPTGKANVPRAGNVMTALSPDGQFFAIAEGTTVEVQQCSDGETVAALQAPPKAILFRYLNFGAPRQLVSVAQISGDWNVQLWNLPEGKLAKDFKLPDSFDKATLSADGRYLATVVNRYGVVIYDLQKSPSKGKAKVSARIPITPLERAFIDVDGLSFSPSGEELAAVCDNGSRLLCWDKTTHLILEHALDSDRSSTWTGAWTYRGPAIEWHPGGRGWLVKGHFFVDRQRRRVTWLLKTDFGSNGRHRFIDEDRLLVSRGNRELADVKIPWKKLDDSLAAMNDDASSAWLGPGQPVSIQVQLGSLSGGASPPQVESDLRQLFAARLAVDEINVADDQPIHFVIDYSETYEPSRTIAPPNFPGMRFNIPARQVPGHTTCTMNIRLQAVDSPSDLWSSKVSTGVADGDPAGPRPALYAALARQLRGALLPCFIPKDKDLISLPAVLRP